MATWFTSDFHFGHEKEFLWKPRGFTDWKEHAERVIENYNSLIKADDIVYILGDCMLKNDEYGLECLKQLNGRKYLAIGNHDSNRRIELYDRENIFKDIRYGYRFEASKISFWAQHYPAMMGNYKDKHPTICLAGHTHSPDPYQAMDNGTYNVALDAHKCYPVSLAQIIEDVIAYHKTHPVIEYEDRSPYCKYCKFYTTCAARPGHELPCPGYKSNEN